MGKDYSENELLYLIRQKDEEALAILIERYRKMIWGMVHALSHHARHMRVSLDDMYQEGLCGLLEAVDKYREDLKVPFYHFARICIDRQIRSLLRRHRGLSFGLLHGSVSLDLTISEDDNLFLSDTIAINDSMHDPIWRFYYNEGLGRLKILTEEMSTLEKDVYNYRQQGYSYEEIATLCDCSYKSVDNALQRIKKKLLTLFD